MKKYLAKLWRFLHFPKHVQLSIMRILQDNFLIGVTGVVLNDKNEILVFKHTYREVQWSLPGGYLGAKEHPLEGLEREIEEESGFIVSGDRQLRVRTDRETARIDICVVGKFIGGEFRPSHEVTEYGFFSFDKLPLIPKNQLFLINEALIAKKERREVKEYLRQKKAPWKSWLA